MKDQKLSLADIDQWVDNDEALYNWAKNSRLNRREFIKQNRQELTTIILNAINRPPKEKTWHDYCR